MEVCYFCICRVCGMRWIVYAKPIRCPYCDSGHISIKPTEGVRLRELI